MAAERVAKDQLILEARAGCPGVDAADARADRLLEALRRCVEHTPEDESRQAAIGYAHRAAILRRNALIERWQQGQTHA